MTRHITQHKVLWTLNWASIVKIGSFQIKRDFTITINKYDKSNTRVETSSYAENRMAKAKYFTLNSLNNNGIIHDDKKTRQQRKNWSLLTTDYEISKQSMYTYLL